MINILLAVNVMTQNSTAEEQKSMTLFGSKSGKCMLIIHSLANYTEAALF